MDPLNPLQQFRNWYAGLPNQQKADPQDIKIISSIFKGLAQGNGSNQINFGGHKINIGELTDEEKKTFVTCSKKFFKKNDISGINEQHAADLLENINTYRSQLSPLTNTWDKRMADILTNTKAHILSKTATIASSGTERATGAGKVEQMLATSIASQKADMEKLKNTYKKSRVANKILTGISLGIMASGGVTIGVGGVVALSVVGLIPGLIVAGVGLGILFAGAIAREAVKHFVTKPHKQNKKNYENSVAELEKLTKLKNDPEFKQFIDKNESTIQDMNLEEILNNYEMVKRSLPLSQESV